MTLRLVVTILGLLVGLTTASVSSADTPPRKTFALVVTSNHGGEGRRPDLRYADDDGVKYAELFGMLAGPANVLLHTELDRDTARLYPGAKTGLRPPRKSEVLASAHELAERVRVAVRDGSLVDFYFVFAGHGDVDRGKGYLELADGRLTADDVEALLSDIPSTRTHVILDSCNSFFVLAPRKPGGRIVATTVELASSLAKRLPNVGVFLSTSAEAEVYEWSELQAGIFSHAVRSGLAGAADADGDGTVTYEELRAFTVVATDRIKNPQYRPHVYARGPAGNDREAVALLGAVKAKRVRVASSEAVRLTVKDAEDVPLIDLHKEEGARVELLLPERWATGASLDRLVGGAVDHHALVRDEDEVLALNEPPLRSASAEPRGVVEALRSLFSSPFGPRALEQLRLQRADDAEDVFGVDQEHVDRLRLVWAEAAAGERDRRIRRGTVLVAASAALAAGGTYLLTETESPGAFPYLMYGYGAVTAAVGMGALLVTSSAEDANANYARTVDKSGRTIATPDAKRAKWAFAVNENNLFVLADGNRRQRDWARWTSAAVVTASTIGLVANELEHVGDTAWRHRFGYGAGILVFGTLFVDSFLPTPMERLSKLWALDPGRARMPTDRVSFAASPVAGGGVGTLRWKF